MSEDQLKEGNALMDQIKVVEEEIQKWEEATAWALTPIRAKGSAWEVDISFANGEVPFDKVKATCLFHLREKLKGLKADFKAL